MSQEDNQSLQINSNQNINSQVSSIQNTNVNSQVSLDQNSNPVKKKSTILSFLFNFFSAFFIGILFALAVVIIIYTISITYTSVKQIWVTDLCSKIFRNVDPS